MESQLSKLTSVPLHVSFPGLPLQSGAQSPEGRPMPQVYLGEAKKGVIFLTAIDVHFWLEGAAG